MARLRTTALSAPALGIALALVIAAIAFAATRPGPAPRAAIRGVWCHWHGRYLIARGTVVNLSDRDATFTVRPDIVVVGVGRLAPNVEDFVAVGAGGSREWRWTDRSTGVPSGTAVTGCAATVSFPRGNPEDD
jgi:hypothetical protein